MILKNAKLFNDSFEVIRADVETDGEKIARIGPELPGTGHSIDLSGCVILPGLVDIHIHGCAGADTFDGTRDAIERMAAHLVKKGVTVFCPTTMTGSSEQIAAALSAVRDCMDRPPQGAAVLGAHMEGPYLSAGKKGAQRGDALRLPDFAEFLRLYHGCGGAIRLVDVAPECENARDLITRASEFCTVSVAHSEADYDTAMQGFQWGITHATHLFNAMTGFHHRQPGIVGAVFDSPDVRAAEYEKPEWGRFTQGRDRLYAHIFDRGIGPVILPGMAGRIRSARLLCDGSEVSVARPWNQPDNDSDAFLNLPSSPLPDESDTVVVLELEKGESLL